MNIDLKNALEGSGVSEWRYFDAIESTNTEALAWAESGAPDFSLVIADEQTGGRGRFERRWVTLPGSSLAFSLILRPSALEFTHLPLYSPLCGIAVQEAVNRLLHIPAAIKWPNDVLIDSKKFCGILVEAAWRESHLQGVVLGIGINVNAGSIPPPANQSFPAACLEHAAGHPVDRYAVLKGVLRSLAFWRGRLASPEFMQHWQEHLAFKGQWVRIEGSEKPAIIGKIEGIDDSGQLVLSDAEGHKTSIVIGDVHLRPAETSDPGGSHA